MSTLQTRLALWVYLYTDAATDDDATRLFAASISHDRGAMNLNTADHARFAGGWLVGKHSSSSPKRGMEKGEHI